MYTLHALINFFSRYVDLIGPKFNFFKVHFFLNCVATKLYTWYFVCVPTIFIHHHFLFGFVSHVISVLLVINFEVGTVNYYSCLRIERLHYNPVNYNTTHGDRVMLLHSDIMYSSSTLVEFDLLKIWIFENVLY